jgi:hypothetical protein
MLLAIANAAKSAQNCQNLPKSTQDETLKYHQKLRFLVFFRNKIFYV